MVRYYTIYRENGKFGGVAESRNLRGIRDAAMDLGEKIEVHQVSRKYHHRMGAKKGRTLMNDWQDRISRVRAASR